MIADGSFARRDFLKGVGGGIVIFVSLGTASLVEAQQRGRQLPDDFNAFLRIGADGRTTCFTGKIEMGQGVITSLPQMLADELDVDVATVDMVMGDTDLCPYDMGTFGSMTTRFFGPPLRAAAAEARAVLLALAAERLGVPVDRLSVTNGVVSDTADAAKSVTYAQLAQGKAIARRLDGAAVQKTVAQFKVIGTPMLHADARAKVTGEAKYAGDIRLPGMLYARIVRPPAHDAVLKTIDTKAAEAIAGVQVVRDGDFVAVLHETPDGAARAVAAVKAEYEVPQPPFDDTTIFDHLLEVAGDANVAASGGDIAAGRKLAAKTVETTYLNSYVAHAPIEPHVALVHIENAKATGWASSQAPFRAKGDVAAGAGVSEDNVHVISPFVGGGFGGKTRNLQAGEAARLAKLTGKPVQVQWTRAEEFFYDTFRPAAVVKISAGTTDAGKIAFWDYSVYFAGERGSQQFYNIPNHRTASYGERRGGPSAHPFGTGAWRAPANNTNTFARESHIEALAAAAGVDPLEFRLTNLADERMAKVLRAAAELFGYTPAKGPSGRGYGIACGTDSGTYVAHVAEVAVDEKTGAVTVKRVACAQDMGIVINPEGAKIQMEGCVTMGLGYALTEEIHFKGGKVEDLNFDTYQLPRFSWLPEIKTVLVKDDDVSPQGGGEPAIICMGAVIANAIFDATGARVLQLPMTKERVKAALAARASAQAVPAAT
jgi:isoquinoline 1-oxidoreductase